MNPVKVGVVGVGYLGKYHARIYSRMENVKLVGVVDIHKEACESVARECGCAAYDKPDDLLGKVDAVSIVVPTVHHLKVAKPFLEQGIHMLMEKPISSTIKEGNQIIELAKNNNAILQIGHLERYNPGMRTLCERVEDARFIEAHRLGPFVGRATDVDVVTDLMIHDIDIVMTLVKSEVTRIDAVGIPVLTDHADIANARLEFANGAVANVTASRVSSKRFRRIRVFGKARYYALDYQDQVVEIVKAIKSDKGDDEHTIVRETIEIEQQPPLDAELVDFISCINEGRQPVVDGATGLKALEMAFKVKEKIAECKM